MDGTRERVVVGYDGSDHARRALRWAAVEAARRHARLEVTAVVDDGGLGIRGPVGMAHWWPEVAIEGGRRLATQGADVIRETWPDLDVEAVGRAGLPAAVLVDASRTADLLIVGTRGLNPLAEMALGSVAERVAAHGYCPVVVVHGDVAVHPGPGHPVVVGVDDSAGARRAVDVAARWAHDAGAPLSVICAWMTREVWEYDVLPTSQQSELEKYASTAARNAVDAAVARALELHPDLQVTGSTRRGEPSQVLTELGDGAGLVVVGSRGRGVIASLLLGSVSHALVGTATCAVAVVGEHTRSEGDEPAGGSREAHDTSAGTASTSAPVS
jgi:nucleotide-binding universal stress UspA family protein